VSDATLPPCPDCAGGFTYQVDALLTCPECGHEWSPSDDATPQIRDAVGSRLLLMQHELATAARILWHWGIVQHSSHSNEGTTPDFNLT